MQANGITVDRDQLDFHPLTFSEAQTAVLLGISLKTLRNLRTQGKGPAYCKSTRETTVYLVDDIRCYLLARRTEPVTPAATPSVQQGKRGRGRPRKTADGAAAL